MPADSHSNKNTWKVWVEKESKKLHVHGEVYVQDKTLFYQLDRQDPQGYFEDELMLVIKPKFAPGGEKVEIKYHEELESGRQYKKVTISSNNEQIAQITEVAEK